MPGPILLLPKGESPPESLDGVTVVTLEPFRQRIVHDLRNPLGIIIGNAELLREEVFGPLTERQQGALETIERQAERLTAGLEELADALDGEEADVR
ncbi:MAG: hypothetical protein GY913_08700 [Proteobacteria bacterium]|nr:hypothetical protein [Pseudomonadota bacterium]